MYTAFRLAAGVTFSFICLLVVLGIEPKNFIPSPFLFCILKQSLLMLLNCASWAPLCDPPSYEEVKSIQALPQRPPVSLTYLFLNSTACLVFSSMLAFLFQSPGLCSSLEMFSWDLDLACFCISLGFTHMSHRHILVEMWHVFASKCWDRTISQKGVNLII